MTLVLATPAHAAAMAAIHEAAFPPADIWPAPVFATQLSLPGTWGVVADAGGFALARAVAEDAELLTLAVMPGQRRQGIGRALLDAVLTQAALRGATSLFLEVACSNHAARALYAGAHVVGQRPNYYADGRDALVLRLDMPR